MFAAEVGAVRAGKSVHFRWKKSQRKSTSKTERPRSDEATSRDGASQMGVLDSDQSRTESGGDTNGEPISATGTSPRRRPALQGHAKSRNRPRPAVRAGRIERTAQPPCPLRGAQPAGGRAGLRATCAGSREGSCVDRVGRPARRGASTACLGTLVRWEHSRTPEHPGPVRTGGVANTPSPDAHAVVRRTRRRPTHAIGVPRRADSPSPVWGRPRWPSARNGPILHARPQRIW